MKDLFDIPETNETDTVPSPHVYTVSELTGELRTLLEDEYPHVIVEGEISNWKVSGAGHAYFRLKDEGAVLESVIWKSKMLQLRKLGLADGQAVQVTGRLSIYPARGQHQIIVESIRFAGVGLLQQRFEELKRRLDAEGLFDAAKKKPLPFCPRRIGLATSATGAALQDFLKVVREHRLPLDILVAPCRVQGVEAPAEIAEAVARLDRIGLDLLVAMRGGGSIEDLWAFNEEVVARAIAACRTPLISAVGHEVDFTISDLVADLRAPTPTGAALLLAGLYSDHRNRLVNLRNELAACIRTALRDRITRIEHTRRALLRYHPRALVEQHRRRLDEIGERLSCSLVGHLRSLRKDVDGAESKLRNKLDRRVHDLRYRMQVAQGRLQALNPEATLKRGFAVCQKASTGEILFDPNEADMDESLVIRLREGLLGARATGPINETT